MPTKPKIFNGHDKAFKIDVQINQMLTEYPLTKLNALDWCKFTMTVRTGLKVIEETAMHLLLKKD